MIIPQEFLVGEFSGVETYAFTGEYFFLSLNLLIPFQTCHWCFVSNPALSISQSGTMLTIRSTWGHYPEVFTWTSRPFVLGKVPAGKLLLSFDILCSGASINKILLVFRHMCPCLSLSNILLPSKKFAGYFSCKVLARLPGRLTHKTRRKLNSGACWGWQTWYHGPFRKISNMHDILVTMAILSISC